MIEGQKDQEAGEVDNAGDRWAEKRKLGIQTSDSSGKNRAGECKWCNLNKL